MELLSVVILNYNGRKHLETFLPPVTRYSQGHEIIIADNHSTDDSLSFLEENYPSIRIIQLGQNYGFCSGYNLALRQIDSKYYVLLNSDVEVTEGWISPILDLMESSTNIAACQPKILSYTTRNLFEYAGAGGGFIDFLGYPFCRGRIFDTLEEDQGQYDSTTPVFWATGACLFVRAEVFYEMGGFDDDFFAHMEEIDLCWRMKSSGYEVWYSGDSCVYHLGGGTLPKSNPRKTYLNFRNSLLVLIKNHRISVLFLALFLRLMLDCIAMIKFMVRDSVQDSLAVLKAYIYVIGHFIPNFKKRNIRQLQNSKKITELYNSSIVLNYFLKGKKKFSDYKINNTK